MKFLFNKKLWSLEGELTFVRKVENWIYRTENKKFFIRITEPSHRNYQQLESELHWMNFLETEGVQFAHLVHSSEKKLVEIISCKDGDFYASVFKRANGGPLLQKEDFTSQRMKNWGKIIGNLHAKGEKYTKPNSISSRPQWNAERNYEYIQDLCTPDDELYSTWSALKVG